jgi:hypothetical protein
MQVFYLNFCNGYTCVFKFFLVFCKCLKHMLQVFQLFRTYVASVSSEYHKSRSGVAHVAMRVRSGGGASGSYARSGGMGPRGHAKCRLEPRRADPNARNGSVAWAFRVLALPNIFNPDRLENRGPRNQIRQCKPPGPISLRTLQLGFPLLGPIKFPVSPIQLNDGPRSQACRLKSTDSSTAPGYI